MGSESLPVPEVCPQWVSNTGVEKELETVTAQTSRDIEHTPALPAPCLTAGLDWNVEQKIGGRFGLHCQKSHSHAQGAVCICQGVGYRDGQTAKAAPSERRRDGYNVITVSGLE